MLKYVLKRFLIFIPTLFVISLLIFGLSKLAPGDPVELLLKGGTNAGNTGQRADLESGEADYQRKAQQLGLDKPTFYFSLSSAAYPKDLYKISKQIHRENISRLISIYGNSDAAMAYYQALRAMELACADLTAEADYDSKKKMRDAVDELYFRYEDKDVQNELKNLKDALSNPTLAAAQPAYDKLAAAYKFMQDNPTTHLLYAPTLHWYGFANQYHTWMFGDMPWLYSIDSTPYRQVADLTARMDALGKNRDSLNKALKDVKLRVGVYTTDLANPPAGVSADSLRGLISKLEADSSRLTAEMGSFSDKIKTLSNERDSLKKTLVTYTGKGFVRGDFGTSYKDNRPVATKMKEALFWTIIMNFLSIFLSYIVSIPLGVQSAVWKKNTLQFFTFVSYPTLIIATIANVLIAGFTFWNMPKWMFVLGMATVTSVMILIELLKNRSVVKGQLNMFGAVIYVLSVVAAITILGLSYVLLGLPSWALTMGVIVLALAIIVAEWYYLAEVRGVLGGLWGVIYTISIGLLLMWLWILIEMLLAAAVIVVTKFPIMTGIIVGFVLAVSFYNRRQRKELPKQANVFNDGLGNFRFSAAGLQTRGSILDNISTTALFVLYSLPSFWIAMILIVFLTTVSYGLSWFPSGGAQSLDIAMATGENYSKYGIGTRLADILHHLVLPVVCMTYGSFAFLSRQMRGSMLGVLKQDYIRTATAKGLDEDKIVWKHAFRNSLFPIITMFSSVFPRALSGSIAIESIYSIQGMGFLSLEAINGRDWPIVFTVALLAAILTMIGNLVSDILYSVADPRVTFK